MTDPTYYQLRQLCITMLDKARADGARTHTPDKFLEQGYDSQLSHAHQHMVDARWLKPENWTEDHLAHAFARILFAALIRENEHEYE